MDRRAMRVAWYRFRRTFARRRGGYLALVLLIGLIGGVSMGSIAAARRTQSSYPKYLASTNPSNLNVSSFGANSSPTTPSLESATLTNEIAHLTDVKHVESIVVPTIVPLSPNGGADFSAGNNLAIGGSVDGRLSDQDRVTVIHGRMFDPSRVDEFVMTADAAKAIDAHVGQVIPLGAYTSAQTNLPGMGTPSVPPHLRINDKLVGIVVLNNQVLQDDVDRLPAFVLLSPAATQELLAESTATLYGVQLVHGNRDVPAVEQEFARLLPSGTTYEFHVISRVESTVERAVKPEAIALGVFGAIAALAALSIAAQAISRQLRTGAEDLDVLRALGASPTAIASDGLTGVLGAVVLGSLVAMAVALGLSPLAPLGPVRPVYPGLGIAFDWTVLGIGVLVLIGGLGGVAAVLAFLGAPHRATRRSRLVAPRSSSIARVATSSGLSPAGVVGVRFALEPGRGRTAVPVRSAFVGTAVAVVMVVATLTFGSGLRTLVSRPALYGWNWSYALNPTNDVPPQALTLLDHDPDVAAWTGEQEVIVQIDGQNIPGLIGQPGDPHPAVSPPILSGQTLASDGQIVLGAASLAQLHKHLGDTVVVSYGTPRDAPVYIPPTPLAIVGTATMPAVGFTSFVADHTSMGIGALLPGGIIPPAFQQASRNADPNLNGPELVLVRMRPGLSAAAGRADLQGIADAANKAMAADPNATSNSIAVLGVQHPAEIVNYRSVGATPVILASGLAAGATVALGLTLAASVRRRRRDLALLKALGFTRRQLTAAVAWQATVAAVIGVVVGVPLGIALGRQLWILFARDIYAVPEPTVPVLSVILVAVGALVFANVVAAFPGRAAARTPAALVLRAE